MKIAVFINLRGEIATLFEAGNLTLFSDNSGVWLPVNEIPFQISEDTDLQQIRQQTWQLREAIRDCRHLVVQKIHGAQIAWFDGLGVQLWQDKGTVQALSGSLDAIREQAHRQEVEALPALSTAFITPGKQAGEFQVDLITALKSDVKMTSKQILLPLFTSRAFRQVEVICDHLPKWFARELPALQLRVATQTDDKGLISAVVSPASS